MTATSSETVNAVRNAIQAAWIAAQMLANGREKSLVLTKLDEARLWLGEVAK